MPALTLAPIDFRSAFSQFNSRIRKKMARTSDGPTAMAFMQGW
jgi:oxygen-independent coproporphyrinogen-3 oxidase